MQDSWPGLDDGHGRGLMQADTYHLLSGDGLLEEGRTKQALPEARYCQNRIVHGKRREREEGGGRREEG